MPRPRSDSVSGWGRVADPGRVVWAERLEAATDGVALLRGLGRSYGDSASPPSDRPVVLATPLADRILAFDPASGLLTAEAGLSLYALNRLLHPRGYFVPVTPGTQFVTLGGMVAADVHGKMHHSAGTIGRHVRALRMRIADGETGLQTLTCSPTVHADLFWATVGGMGLTGAILDVTLQLERIPSPWIEQEVTKHGNLDELLSALQTASATWPSTVAWIDCLRTGAAMGRGVLFAGRWAPADIAPAHSPRWARRGVAFPLESPIDLLTPWTVRIFNEAVYRKQLRARVRGLTSPEQYFYPLDIVKDWNLAYGRRGLTQHQAVLPREAGSAAVRAFLQELTRTEAASFLCVLKDCGDEGGGLLSFPRPGTSIAIDLPVRRDTPAVIARLNAAAHAFGGRIYLAKDRFTTAADFAAMEPRLPAFLEARRRWDPHLRFRSAQSVRLFGDPCEAARPGAR